MNIGRPANRPVSINAKAIRIGMKVPDVGKPTIMRRNTTTKAPIGISRSVESINKQILTTSIKIEVIIGDVHHIFDKKKDAVKFTGVNANQIDKLIKENKKSRKGYLFKLYVDFVI